MCCCTSWFFFFSSRRRHTRYWRDWSSDVCSSDLAPSPLRITSRILRQVATAHKAAGARVAAVPVAVRGWARGYTAAVERPQLRKAVGGGPGVSGAAVWAWVLYDFANTIFAVTVLSLFFPLWVEERVGDGAFFSAPGLVNGAAAVSALLVVLSAPVLGAVADFRQRRVAFLALPTPAPLVPTAG